MQSWQKTAAHPSRAQSKTVGLTASPKQMGQLTENIGFFPLADIASVVGRVSAMGQPLLSAASRATWRRRVLALDESLLRALLQDRPRQSEELRRWVCTQEPEASEDEAQ